MKQHYKIFPVDIFKRGVLVFHGTRDQFKAYVEREEIPLEFDEEGEEIMDKSNAVTFRMDEDVIIFSEREWIDEGVLIHEILHASKQILRKCDIEDEEALAYLLEYLCGEILPWARSTFLSVSDDAPSA